MTRYAARVDNSHALIRDAIRKAGFYTFDTHALGGGFPDLLAVSRSGRVILFEIKSPGEWLTPREAVFFEEYPAALHVIHTAEEAIGYLEA